jgi:hypothetical protein
MLDRFEIDPPHKRTTDFRIKYKTEVVLLLGRNAGT